MNLTSDYSNCGVCGSQCTAGQSCVSSSCSCPASLLLCSGVCVNKQTDIYNCGGCGQTCPTSASCVSGTCECPDFASTNCNGECVDTSTNIHFCGSCSTACASRSCVLGTCVLPSGPSCGIRDCGPTVDTCSDKQHCNGCGVACQGICFEGNCLIALLPLLNISVSQAVGQVGANLLPIGNINAYFQVSTLSRLINPFGRQFLLSPIFPDSSAWPPNTTPGSLLSLPTPLIAFVSLDFDEYTGYAAGVMLVQAGPGLLSYCAVGDRLQFLQYSANSVVVYRNSYAGCSLVDATSSFSAFEIPMSPSNSPAAGFVFQTFNGDISFGYCSGSSVMQHDYIRAPYNPGCYQTLLGSTGTQRFLVFMYLDYDPSRFVQLRAKLVFYLNSGQAMVEPDLPSDIGRITNCFLYADGNDGLYLHYIGSESSRVLYYYALDPRNTDFTNGAVIPTHYILSSSPFAFVRANKFGHLVYFFYNYPAQYLQCSSATVSQDNNHGQQQPSPHCVPGYFLPNLDPRLGKSKVIAAAINQVDTGLAVIYGDLVNGVYASVSCGSGEVFSAAFSEAVTNNLNVDYLHPEVSFEQLSLAAISNDCNALTGAYFAIPYNSVLEIFSLSGRPNNLPG